jgi:cytidylate kinase
LAGFFFNAFLQSMSKIIITVDGFSSCGKSTLARQLAKQLKYVFIDSGAMYRAITLYFLREDIDINNTIAITEALSKINLQFKFNTETQISDMYLNNENVEKQIREMAVSEKVSEVSTLKLVRDFAVSQQQKMGEEKGIVMDGRDIGTAVFPNAELKLFITANPEIRVERRYKELTLKGDNISKQEVKENLEKRDLIDSTREISPLRKADDAIVIDNSFLTRDEQLEKALQLVSERIN